jgi:hypothetical protein
LKITLVLLLVTGPSLSMGGTTEKTANVLILDTMSPFVNKVDLQGRAEWKVVPTDLLTLELDPLTAFSDPGYYGREYTFKGDAVVENEHLTAVFFSKRAEVVVYSKAYPSKKKIALIPVELKGKPASISDLRILQNTGDEAALKVSFHSRETGQSSSAVVAFDKTGIVEIKPGANMKGISLCSPMEYGIVPSFIGDDLILNPREYPSAGTLCVPSENLFLGLLSGRDSVLVVTWPEGKQQSRLMLSNKQREPRLIESFDLENDGKNIYLAMLSAPGIWHKEQLTPSYLERDVASNWKRPFPAKWITQLVEGGVKTTFTFREFKAKIWRGVVGSYSHPVWFNGQNASYHLSKRIPPKGESIVYFLERDHTPASISTPVDILKATLGRQACDTILDPAGRKLRTHHRRAGEGVRRACTCGCTEAIQTVFDAGEEVQRKEYVEGAVDDMVYFVTRHMERIGEYQDFASDMMKFLALTRRSNPDLKPFLDGMESITQEITREYDRQRENIKSLKYADELTLKTKALTRKKDPKNLATYADLSMKWRKMGGAQDDLVAQCHRITRKLFQAAGYGCATQPKAVEIAQQIRARCRRCLRNPDGYEIWANY